MEFEYRYHGHSEVDSGSGETTMSFAPDTLREPTFFKAQLHRKLPFREAISALNGVVVSDLRFQPKDRSEYMRWLAENEQQLLADFMRQGEAVAAEIDDVQDELTKVYRERSKLMKPYYEAQDRYFKYLYKHDYDAWFVLDPVISVHPDELSFECFSQDESSYGRLSCSYEVFEGLQEFACGTTNIDYSAALYDEFQKIRGYRDTTFEIAAGGFDVQTGGDDAYHEQKIDLPESWVRGFLQVSSAMTLPAAEIELHPMDLHNICFQLKRRREKHGPRSIRWILEPGKPVRLLFEPWNTELRCPRSIYHGTESREIRLWGRRRLLILERLIPVAKAVKVRLLGSGLPSFFSVDLGGMQFTLGLSGWTANDWSQQSSFDLLMPRAELDSATSERVFAALAKRWFASADALAAELGLERSVVVNALTRYVQAGRAIYDQEQGVFRRRELSREPLPVSALQFASEREERAARFVQYQLVKKLSRQAEQQRRRVTAVVTDNATEFKPELVIDNDECLVSAVCGCHFYVQNKLYKGPCEHMLAVRQLDQQQQNQQQGLRS